MRSFIALALLGITAVFAAPAPSKLREREAEADASPVELEARTLPTLSATTLTQYNVWNGALDYDVTGGLIFKDGRSPDITTVATFDFPSSWKNKRCKFNFKLVPSSLLSGSKRFDIFTTLSNPTRDTHSWPPGSQRNQHYGRMIAVQNGPATFEAGQPVAGQDFACPYGGKFSYELVGVYDAVKIAFSKSNSGPTISRLN